MDQVTSSKDGLKNASISKKNTECTS